ncbi:hypothetical protein DSO57_1014989 [Entomophthora muscae]|uniref:Uncharacterized protein n=1 Tax=Entomophthora muscae TaxID=34485 RepID=A0ACC2UQX9_9FUNG|nr:hypothetical protein DSO57_1014989 [Entomophthora muscae]
MFSAILITAALVSQVQPKATKYIVGGQPGDARQYKHLVRIVADHKLCGGSLIAKNAILTAAHCTQNPCPKAYDIRPGRTTQAEMDKAPRLNVVSVHSHRGFNDMNFSADISVIRIDPNHDMNTFLAVDTHGVTEGTSLHLAGWGVEHHTGRASPHLKTLGLKVVPSNICQRLFNGFNANTHICGGSGLPGNSGCMGDSGSPLVLGGKTVVGVVSYGDEYCRAPGSAFTRVATFANWIKRVVESRSPSREASAGRCNPEINPRPDIQNQFPGYQPDYQNQFPGYQPNLPWYPPQLIQDQPGFPQWPGFVHQTMYKTTVDDKLDSDIETIPLKII